MGLDEITAEWLSGALSRRQPGVQVSSVRMGEPVHGTGTNVKLSLEYDRPPEDGPGLPDSMWLKAGFEPHFESLAISGLYQNEALFYDQLAPRVAISVPRCFYAGADRVSRQGVIVLEDLAAAGADFGRATRPLTADGAAVVLEALAGFHASTWGCTWMSRLDFVTPGIPTAGPGASYFLEHTPDVFRTWIRERPDANTPESVNDPERIVRAFWALAEISCREPACLIHSDAHLDNVYFLPDGTPGYLDWGSPRVSSWAWDVNYFLVSALEIEECRRCEQDLLRHYLDRLRSHDVDSPGFDEAWLAYRQWNAYGLFVKIVNPDYFKPREINVAWMSRHVAAAEDLETFRSLGV